VWVVDLESRKSGGHSSYCWVEGERGKRKAEGSETISWMESGDGLPVPAAVIMVGEVSFEGYRSTFAPGSHD